MLDLVGNWSGFLAEGLDIETHAATDRPSARGARWEAPPS